MSSSGDAGYPGWAFNMGPGVNHIHEHPVFPLGGHTVMGHGPRGIFGSRREEDPGRSPYYNGDPSLAVPTPPRYHAAGTHAGASSQAPPHHTNDLGSWPTPQNPKYPSAGRPFAPPSGGPLAALQEPTRFAGLSSQKPPITNPLGYLPPSSQNQTNSYSGRPDIPSGGGPSSGYGLPFPLAGAYDTLRRVTPQRPSGGPSGMGYANGLAKPALVSSGGYHRLNENGPLGSLPGFHGGMQDLPRVASLGPTQSASYGNGYHSGQPPNHGHALPLNHRTGPQEPPSAGDFFSNAMRAFPDDGFGRPPAVVKDRVVDPFTEQVEPGRLRVNALIGGTSHDDDGFLHGRRTVEWNMLYPDSTCKVLSSGPDHVRRAALDEPATFPRLSRLDIRLPRFPAEWTINVVASDQFTGVTCRDIIQAIYLSLYAFASSEDYRSMDRERQKEIGEVYRVNRERIGGLGEGMRRLDCLGDEVMFGGIVGGEEEVESAIGRRLPGTFVLKAVRP